ncbi:hypothetical protein [Sinorhizobium sp. BG8]|uniref:hypothetical protein n=1 Tax=Sinorhizobium sp. BG8 TaxID=2613773 RepID=UPI00193D5362|nr:hypothetical protein [Sinorhizobium sp. BG8]QRM54745.1 hypothetical protein F3Y30_09465 [Sinorhizobium sp. BG8]
MQSIYNPDDKRQIAATINDLVRQFENIGSVTLASSTTSTTVSNPKVLSSSVIVLQPRTSTAAGAQATTYVSSVSGGQFVITHASATTSRIFDYVIYGV